MKSLKVVQPQGILNGISANELRRDINDLVLEGADIVLIDFQDVTFIDSSGLGALVATLKSVRSAGAKLYVCSINEQVKMVFELTRMERIFESFTSRDEFNRQLLTTQ